jgi:hypothetical protein
MPSDGFRQRIRVLGVAIAASLTLGVMAWPPAASGWSTTGPMRLDPAVAGCSAMSHGGFQEPFHNPDNLVVGPIAIVFAGGTPEFWPPWPGQKFPVLVKSGHRVTVAVTREAVAEVNLTYAGHTSARAVTFIPCRASESGAGERRRFWSGGVLTASPRCVPLRISIDNRDRPERVAIALGVEGCG